MCFFYIKYFVVFQLLSYVQLVVTPWTAASQAPLSFTITWSLLKLMSMELVMPSNHLILCCLSSSCFQSFRVSGSFLEWVDFSHQVAKVLELQLSTSASNECSGLLSFRIDRFDLLAVQETLKNLLQHHSLKASILPCSPFFMVQLSHPYMTTEWSLLTIW